MRFALYMAAVGVLFSLSLFGWQRRLIYYPRPYDPQFYDPEPEVIEVPYTTGQGAQAAFYLPPRDAPTSAPGSLWVLFPGNASLALDWMDLVRSVRVPDAGYLMIDYPGYGKSAGKPSLKSIGESSQAAFTALAAQLRVTPAELDRNVNVLGLSIGSATGLQFAVGHPVRRVVLLAPFTSMLEMAGRTVGKPLCYLLADRFDNRARLRELLARETAPQVTIVHGNADRVVPYRMGKELGEMGSSVRFHTIEGGTHELLFSGETEGYREVLKIVRNAMK